MDSDASEIVGLITATPLCDECLTRKTGLQARRVRDVLNTLTRSIKLTTKPGRCAVCLKQTVVHRLG